MEIKGFAFWCYSESSPDIEHLYFVISNNCNEETVLIVNMTKVVAGKNIDISCLLKSGEHKEIKYDSFILYSKAMEVKASDILNGILKREYRLSEKISDTLLKKIQNGAKNSKFFPKKFKKYFDCF
jgi:hypothetical protein